MSFGDAGVPNKLTQLPDPDRCFYIDIETDGLLLSEVTKIHSICMTFPNGDQLRYSTLPRDKGIDAAVAMIKTMVTSYQYTPVFHNGAGFDIGVLHKFYPETWEFLSVHNTIDTFLLSCIMEPDREGGHSLEDWGLQLGIQKVQNSEWTEVSERMVHRCLEDTRITKYVYEYLWSSIHSQFYGNDKIIQGVFNGLTLESEVSYIHQKQMDHGVFYDVQTALGNKKKADDIIEKLEKEILRDAPWKTIVPGVALKNQDDVRNGTIKINPIEPFKKDGSYTVNTTKYFGEEAVDKVRGAYSKIECLPMNLGNSAEVKDFLLSLGWEPTEYNYSFKDGRKVRMSPKLTEDSFDSLPEGLGKSIGNYRTYLHRARSIYNYDEKTGELKGALSTVRKDGRVTAKALTCGTPTARYRHMETVCNIPRPSSLFGGEIRETFSVPDDHLLLGLDLKGIENRMLAHYLWGYPKVEAIIEAILATDKGKDFHVRNALIWGVTRDLSKNGLYALMYGCFPKKLAQTLKKPEWMAQELYDDFWKHNEPIRLLVNDLELAYDVNGGWITGLDGRPLFIREKRKLLNTLLQNAAAVVFKRWMVLCYLKWSQWKFPVVHQIIAYHDELQFEVYSNIQKDAENIAKVFSELALEAGRSFNLNVPTPADFKVGKNWRDTH